MRIKRPKAAEAAFRHDRRALLGGLCGATILWPVSSYARNVRTSEQDALPVNIRYDLSDRDPAFEGWGTALAWFANVTGGYPAPVRDHLADLLFGKDGLRWNIARYNIGGGNAPETPAYLRPGADVPGFWRRPQGVAGSDWWRPADPSLWDWNADSRQRWWLDAIRARVPESDQIFEAFSNSPPYFMTVSGRVSGAESGLQANLRPGMAKDFAQYLVTVVAKLQTVHGIRFRTLSPVNEPNTPYWHAANKQEGAHWPPEQQGEIVLATHKALQAAGLRTVVSAMDETDSLTFIRDWTSYPDEVKAAVGQLNVHSYETHGQTGVRDIARQSGKRLWMSEVDLSPQNISQDYRDIRPALALAERIVLDLKRLRPAAWVFWQAIEDTNKETGGGSNWGLIKLDLTAPAEGPHVINVTRKYWAMANFSRYIRPGFTLFQVDDLDTVGACAADMSSVVFVHVNAGPLPRRLDLGAWPQFAAGGQVRLIVTDGTRNAETTSDQLTEAGPLRIDVPAQSVSTIVITNRTPK